MVIKAHITMHYLKRSLFRSSWQILEQRYADHSGDSVELVDGTPKQTEPYSDQELFKRMENLGLTILMRRCREFGRKHLITFDIVCYLADLLKLRSLHEKDKFPSTYRMAHTFDKMPSRF